MAKKVLIVNPYFYNYGQSIYNTFVNKGYQVNIINFMPIQYDDTSIRNKFGLLLMIINLFFTRNKKYKYYSKKKLNSKIINDYFKLKPDIILFIKGDYLYKKTLEKIKESKKILWVMDSIYRLPSSYKLLKYYDFLFMFEKTDIEKLLKEGIKSHFLPLAYDEDIFHNMNTEKEIDIVFIGNLNDNRLTFFYNLADRYKNLNIKIYGKRLYTLNKPWKYFLNKKVFPNKKVSPSEANILYNKSKICLNYHNSQTVYGANPRVYEILASKALQIVDINPYIIDEFENKLLTYSSFEELCNHIDNVIKKYPNDIVEAGFNSVKGRHSFFNRISYMEKVINQM